MLLDEAIGQLQSISRGGPFVWRGYRFDLTACHFHTALVEIIFPVIFGMVNYITVVISEINVCNMKTIYKQMTNIGLEYEKFSAQY